MCDYSPSHPGQGPPLLGKPGDKKRIIPSGPWRLLQEPPTWRYSECVPLSALYPEQGLFSAEADESVDLGWSGGGSEALLSVILEEPGASGREAGSLKMEMTQLGLYPRTWAGRRNLAPGLHSGLWFPKLRQELPSTLESFPRGAGDMRTE